MSVLLVCLCSCEVCPVHLVFVYARTLVARRSVVVSAFNCRRLRLVLAL